MQVSQTVRFGGWRYELWRWVRPRFELPDGNDRNDLRKQHVEQSHRRECRTGNDDFRRRWTINAEAIWQVLVTERGDDDQETLEPHADDDADRCDDAPGNGPE